VRGIPWQSMNRLVGRPAANNQRANPEHTICLIKRKMGREELSTIREKIIPIPWFASLILCVWDSKRQEFLGSLSLKPNHGACFLMKTTEIQSLQGTCRDFRFFFAKRTYGSFSCLFFGQEGKGDQPRVWFGRRNVWRLDGGSNRKGSWRSGPTMGMWSLEVPTLTLWIANYIKEKVLQNMPLISPHSLIWLRVRALPKRQDPSIYDWPSIKKNLLPEKWSPWHRKTNVTRSGVWKIWAAAVLSKNHGRR